MKIKIIRLEYELLDSHQDIDIKDIYYILKDKILFKELEVYEIKFKEEDNNSEASHQL